jgi:ribosomal protein S18 acetylase RimI-like enzyme
VGNVYSRDDPCGHPAILCRKRREVVMSIVREGLVKQRTWSEDELAEARQLLELCDRFEGLSLKLDVGMLRFRGGKETNDFLYYEDGKLVGLLALDELGAEDREMTGGVHPEYRRRGIFSRLLAAAKDEARSRGTERLILVCERFSRSGQGFVAAIGAAYDFSEHRMVLTDFKERGGYQERISLRKAGAEDVEDLAVITAMSFGHSVEGSRRKTLENMAGPHVQYYLGKLGEEAVGCLNLYEAEKEYGIYGFAVLLPYRGRGFGRQMLEQVIKEVRAMSEKGVALEVETNNENAIGLYRSCGFRETTTFGYYTIDLLK